MTSPCVCGKCGVTLGSDTLAGACPGGMLLSALEPDPATVPIPASGQTLVDPAATSEPFLFYRAVSVP